MHDRRGLARLDRDLLPAEWASVNRRRNIEKLEDAVERLEKAYEAALTTYEKEFPDVDPMTLRDTNGRLMLVDALTEIVRGRSALAQASLL